jgi:hypothetical protein
MTGLLTLYPPDTSALGPTREASSGAVVLVLGPRVRRGLAWLLVGALGAYLAYETGRYRLVDVPVPILVGAFAGSLLAAWSLAAVGFDDEVATTADTTPPRSMGWSRPTAAILAIAGAVLLAVAIGSSPVEVAIEHLTRARLPIAAAIVGLAAIGAAVGIGIAERARSAPTAEAGLVVLAFTMMVAQDLVLFQTDGLRDLRLDLRAGSPFDHGVSPYLATPLTVAPADETLLPFLYPPPTLPLFGLLATWPFPLVASLWLSASIAAMLGTLRIFGLSWRWSSALLLWPAIAQGLYVGNVAVFGALLFAIGPIVGAALVVAGLFKAQGSIPALWLIRERRWRELMVGIAIVVILAVVTLPVVGLDSWTHWLRGLGAYQESTAHLPGLYGIALPEYLPTALWIVLSIAAILIALRPAGIRSLERLGLAGIIASPSLYTHGFVVGLPAFLRLRASWFWLAMGLTSTILGPGWWLAVGLGVAAWFLPGQRRVARAEPLHPIQRASMPWQPS